MKRRPACFCAGTQQQAKVKETGHSPPSQHARPSEGTWGDAFGIKHLSDAEWEEHERKRKMLFDQRHVVLCHTLP